jgi:hypothetical protein
VIFMPVQILLYSVGVNSNQFLFNFLMIIICGSIRFLYKKKTSSIILALLNVALFFMQS